MKRGKEKRKNGSSNTRWGERSAIGSQPLDIKPIAEGPPKQKKSLYESARKPHGSDFVRISRRAAATVPAASRPRGVYQEKGTVPDGRRRYIVMVKTMMLGLERELKVHALVDAVLGYPALCEPPAVSSP